MFWGVLYFDYSEDITTTISLVAVSQSGKQQKLQKGLIVAWESEDMVFTGDTRGHVIENRSTCFIWWSILQQECKWCVSCVASVNPSLCRVVFQVSTVLLQWLPWLLRMKRPGQKITRKTILMHKKMKDLDKKDIVSKSLLANVMDIDDDFRWSYAGSLPKYLVTINIEKIGCFLEFFWTLLGCFHTVCLNAMPRTLSLCYTNPIFLYLFYHCPFFVYHCVDQ